MRKALPTQNLRLFDALRAMEVYDHSLLVKSLGLEHKPGLLSPLKAHTYDLVLAVLTESQRSRDRYAMLLRSPAQVNWLVHGGFIQQAAKRNSRAIELAKEIESFGMLLDLITLQREIDRHLHRDGRAKVNPGQWVKLEEDTLLRHQELIRTSRLYYRSSEVKKLPAPLRADEVSQIRESLPDPEICLSNRSRLAVLRASFELAQLEGDHASCYQIAQSIIGILSGNPPLVDGTGLELIWLQFLYAIAAYDLAAGKMDQVRRTMREMEKVGKRSHLAAMARRSTKERIWILELAMAKKEKKARAVAGLLETIKAGLESPSGELDMSVRIGLLHSAAEASLYFQHPHHTGYFVDALLRVRNFGLKPSLLKYSRIMLLIHRYQQGQLDVLEHDLESVERFYRVHGFETVFEKRMIIHFKRVLKAKGSRDVRMEFEALKTDLAEIFQDGSFWPQKYAFDLELWIDSVLQRTTILEQFLARPG